MLGDGFGGRGWWRDFDDFWIHHKFAAKFLNIIRQGRGKKQGLTHPRQQTHDLFNVRNKAHIKHAISFINHQNFDIIEQHFTTLKMIQQATGGGDQNINAFAQCGILVGKADAANQ